jgi:hypothetical protein
LAFSKPLEFETPIVRKGPNISLIPYVSPGLSRTPQFNNQNKFNSKTNLGFGGDAKIGIGSSLNVDLTFNPDFSQKADKDLTLYDNHHVGNKNKGEAIILKMT